MAGPSFDGLSYLLDDSPNSLTLTPGFLTPYPNGLFALGGNDLIVGGSDADRISGDGGNDRLLGGINSDTLLGGSGNDLLLGGSGNDILLGDSGNDTLQGGKGGDSLNGDSGSDVLIGNAGKDTLTGGLGADTFVLGRNSAVVDPSTADIVTDFNGFVDAIGLTDNLTEADLILEEISIAPGISNTLIKLRSNNAILGLVANTFPEELAGTFTSATAVSDFTINLSAIPTTIADNNVSNLGGFDSRFGFGLVNAAAAVAKARNSPTFPDVPDLGGDDWGRDLIKAPEVWAQGLTGDGIVVAVIDSGIDYNHPDLTGNIWSNSGENGVDAAGQNKANNGLDDDNNGFVDDFRGWDFVNNDNEPIDDNNHGTHISGLVAAKKDGVGMTGVAPTAKIMPLKILNRVGLGTIRDEIAAINYAVANGAKVINVSLGGLQLNNDELNAIRAAEAQGAIVISAAGNDARPQVDYPARFANEVGIAVGSIQRNKQFGNYSNRAGSEIINYFIAPGGDGGRADSGDIYSTVPLSVPGIPYRYIAGTSMAVPQVAGVVALMLQANPNLTPADIKRILAETANRSDIIVNG